MPNRRLRWQKVPRLAGLLALLLLAGGLLIVLQSLSSYRAAKTTEVRVEAEILAASVTAALDFDDPAAAEEAVGAVRADRQARVVGVYNAEGQLFAGYSVGGTSLPRTAQAPAPDDGLLRVWVPVMREGTRIGSVHIASQLEPVSRRIARFSIIVLLACFAALIVAVLGAAHRALQEANRALADHADALADSNRELKVQMEERAKAEEALRQSQKMQALGQLTGGIAHDFNNLLTVIQGSADILRKPAIDEAKRIRYAEAIAQTSERAAALTAQLLAFARRQPLKPQVIKVRDQLAGMNDLLTRTLGERIKVEMHLDACECMIEADPVQLEAAVLNIAVNARDAMPDGGSLTITAAPEGEMCAIRMADTGTGIDADALSRVFEPFYTTKTVGKGTGLGLSQVYGFARQSGGEVEMASEPGVGTTVTLLLPRTTKDASVEEPVAVASASLRKARVLLVEDNDEVGAFAEALLGELGHRVVRARSGEEALALAGAERFDVVFSDVVMPGMGGLELARLLRETRPGLPVVLTTGYSDHIAEFGSGGFTVVTKPYRLDAVAAALDDALGGSA